MNAHDHLAAFGLQTETRIEELRRERRRTAVIYGALAGVFFAFGAWGLDGQQLAGSHGYWPWLKLALGGPPAVLAGALVGWLSSRSERTVVGIILWALAGAGLSWAAGRLPYLAATTVLRWVDPGLGNLTKLTFGIGSQTRATIALLGCTVGFMLAGLLLAQAVDARRAAATALAGWLPFLLAGAAFAGAGLLADQLVNAPLRAGVVTTDVLMSFASEHPLETVDPAQARVMHLRAFDPLQDLLGRPRRLIVAGNDGTVQQIQVLIDFDGAQARCTVMLAQLMYCDRVSPQ